MVKNPSSFYVATTLYLRAENSEHQFYGFCLYMLMIMVQVIPESHFNMLGLTRQFHKSSNHGNADAMICPKTAMKPGYCSNPAFPFGSVGQVGSSIWLGGKCPDVFMSGFLKPERGSNLAPAIRCRRLCGCHWPCQTQLCSGLDWIESLVGTVL